MNYKYNGVYYPDNYMRAEYWPTYLPLKDIEQFLIPLVRGLFYHAHNITPVLSAVSHGLNLLPALSTTGREPNISPSMSAAAHETNITPSSSVNSSENVIEPATGMDGRGRI